MDVLGKWKIKAIRTFNDNYERIWREASDILADEDAGDSYKQKMDGEVWFCEDGFVRTVMPVPAGIDKEELAQAVAEGTVELFKDRILLEKYPFRTDGDRILVDTGTRGDVHTGDPDTWIELPQKDGLIEFMIFILKKAE